MDDMKLVVFGDNHNDTDGFERIPILDGVYLHLGDLCQGDPQSARRSIRKIQELGAYCVCGSHDKPVVDDDVLYRWHEMAEEMKAAGNQRAAKRFTKFYDDAFRLRNILEDEYLDFLKHLPETIEIDFDGIRIKAIHDSVVKIGNCRILTKGFAATNLDVGGYDILFHGHTHTPSMYDRREGTAEVRETFFKLSDRRVRIDSETKYLLNPGSLNTTRGYPLINTDSMLIEDGTRAYESEIVRFNYGSYGILDTGERTFEVVFISKS
jgi:predicted phosphodiesterase